MDKERGQKRTWRLKKIEGKQPTKRTDIENSKDHDCGFCGLYYRCWQLRLSAL